MIDALVVMGLAAHRLWIFWLTQEIFRPVREYLSKLHPKVEYLVNCGNCISVWVGVAIGAAWWLDGWSRGLVWVLALSEAIVISEKLLIAVGRIGTGPQIVVDPRRRSEVDTAGNGR